MATKKLMGLLTQLKSCVQWARRFVFSQITAQGIILNILKNLPIWDWIFQRMKYIQVGRPHVNGYLITINKAKFLGNPALQAEFIEYGITLDEENPDICVVAFDTSLEYGRVYNFCKKLYKHEKTLYVATHPDESCPAEECPMPDVGAIIDLIKDTICREPDVIIGKPFESAGDRIQKRFNVYKENIAMVGDRLNTDIAFGNNCGFKSILVLSGETDKEMLSKSQIKPSIVLNSVKDIVG